MLLHLHFLGRHYERMRRGTIIAACLLLSLPAAALTVRAQPNPADADIAQQATVLLDRAPDVPRMQRVEAARRLAQRNSPAARAALASALQERANPAIQAAAATALAEIETPDPSFIDGLFVLVQPDAPGDLARPAARALAKLRDNATVVQRLIDRVTSDRRGEPSRRAAIDALGYVPEKRSAAALIGLLSDDAESTDIRDSAVAALANMTGAVSNGGDIGRWQAWWQDNRNVDDVQFKTNILTGRAGRFDALKPAYDQLVTALLDELGRAYRSASDERRTDLLLGWLSSGQREIRSIGAMIVRNEKASAATVPDTVQQRLQEMVGDSDAGVRFAVAKALAALNYGPALDPMLAQLAVEPNPDVRAALSQALAPIQDLKAVPALLKLLADSDRSVARAAAIALRDLGPKLRREGTAILMAEVSAELRNALRRTSGAGSEAAREALVEAIVPLQRMELMGDLQQMLVPRESARVRQSAVRALAEFGPNAVDAVAPMLADPEATVRLEAARAMGTIGRASELSSLKRLLGPPTETDTSVQAQAWQAIQAIAQKDDTPWRMLAVLANDFSGTTDLDRDRRLQILRIEQAKLRAANRPEDLEALADVCADIGNTHMKFNPPQAADAIDFYKLALDYYRAVNNPMGPDTMIEKLMEARLRAEQYSEAMQFAQSVIAEKAGNIDLVGPKIKAEVDRLAAAGEDAKALKLIAETENFDPKLPTRLRQQLADTQANILRKQTDQLRDRATPPSGPRGGIALPAVGPIRIA